METCPTCKQPKPLWQTHPGGHVDYEKNIKAALGGDVEPTVEYIKKVHKYMVKEKCSSISIPTEMVGKFIKTLTGKKS